MVASVAGGAAASAAGAGTITTALASGTAGALASSAMGGGKSGNSGGGGGRRRGHRFGGVQVQPDGSSSGEGGGGGGGGGGGASGPPPYTPFQFGPAPTADFSPVPLPEDVTLNPFGDLLAATGEMFTLGRAALNENIRSMTAAREAVSPGSGETETQLNQRAQDFMSGEVPADVQERIRQSALERTLVSGTGSGGLNRNIVPRDLGITSLQMIESGMTQAQQIGTRANQTALSLTPDVFGATQRRGEFRTTTEQRRQEFNVSTELEANMFNTELGLEASMFNAEMAAKYEQMAADEHRYAYASGLSSGGGGGGGSLRAAAPKEDDGLNPWEVAGAVLPAAVKFGPSIARGVGKVWDWASGGFGGGGGGGGAGGSSFNTSTNSGNIGSGSEYGGEFWA